MNKFLFIKQHAVALICSLIIGLIPAQPADAKPFRPEKPTKILVIGNSYSTYNNFGNMLQLMCRSAGHKVNVTSVTKNGKDLRYFASYSNPEGRKIHSLLLSQKWDYVILQDRHHYLLKHPNLTKRAVMKLKPYIKRSGAKMALVMTWAPGKGHNNYVTMKDYASTPAEYQLKVANTCRRIAKDVGAIVVPAGLAFAQSQKQNRRIPLLLEDKSHPTLAGSYLYASTVYATLFRRIPDFSYNAGLPEANARALRKAAGRITKDYKRLTR